MRDLHDWIKVLDAGDINYLLPDDRKQLADWLKELVHLRGEDIETKYLFTFWDNGSYTGKTISAVNTKEALKKFKLYYPNIENVYLNGTEVKV